ncbi:rhodanese-like domain-containing protein [Polyangium sp. 6x1]|uniref:rhodanese-like domain-containing protein n=1 Tax=Polyangium sp. 6x1 TaxID=3042689 RepID=UPI002483061B|nr:rhodanese-like domain-containing protein [Polyangium sp. 6x1]MDI1444126.1 rhodanese-like domain-containing protein [Polyangium sp. 6x1]
MHAPAFSAAVLLSLLALVPACSKDESAAPPGPSQQPAAQTGLPDRDPALARKLVAEGGVLIDVRTPEEYAERHLDKATNIPVGELETRLSEVEKLTGGDKTKPIVVHCAAGPRAARAKKILLGAGYTQVTNLGGINDWDAK